VPTGMLQITIDAQDNAVAYGGTLAAHPAPASVTPARTTRLLWLMTLSGAAVSGLAVHPSGDLIVTMDGGAGDTVYDLASDQPLVRWGVTLSLSGDGVIGTPAIGAGDAGNARIYVASMNGDLYAIEANGDADAGWRKLLNTVGLFAVG